MVRYIIEKNVDTPTPARGGHRKWDLPLSDLKIGYQMTLPMNGAEARKKVAALRSYIDRQQKELGIMFSVYITDDGLCIFRRETTKMQGTRELPEFSQPEEDESHE